VPSLVAEGTSNGAIASRLVVTARTVEALSKQTFMELGLPASRTSDRHPRRL
jgi:DNA-binding NarL/FixJ family response regulator